MKEQNSINHSISRVEGDIKILFCGDTFLRTHNRGDPFALISSCFKNRVVCLNLETSLKGGEQKEKNVCLSIDENSLDMIPEIVRILSLVNNHVSDSGNPIRLVQVLEKRGRVLVGPDNPSQARITLNRMDIDLFSAYFGLPRLRVSYNGARANTLEQMLQNSNAQRKIVNLHWGYEHTDTPAPFQRELAHCLVDVGADIIIGHHPHVPQGEEIYKGKHIYYSLGNFNFWQFDTETTENNRWGYMVRYDLDSGEAKPILYRINDNYQPYLVSCEEEAYLHSKLNHLSKAARTVDGRKWFKTDYASWYAHELGVWKKLCFGGGSPRLWLKWLAWLCMPLQLKYYAYALRFRIGGYIWRRS